jgi:peptidylprolyl isomerase
MKKNTLLLAILTVVGLAEALGPASAGAADAANTTDLPSGLRIIEDKIGTGDQALSGKTVTVNYTGWLYQNGKKGTKFDSSLDRNQPFSFALGAGQVIQGWDQGVAGMKVGGMRTLIIPPDLGYAGQNVGDGLIPPWSTLIFDVELLKVQ